MRLDSGWRTRLVVPAFEEAVEGPVETKPVKQNPGHIDIESGVSRGAAGTVVQNVLGQGGVRPCEGGATPCIRAELFELGEEDDIMVSKVKW